MCADIWTRHDTLWRTDNSPTLPDWLIGSSGFRTWETRTDGSSLQSTDWLCLDWTRWTATVALRAETRWKEFFLMWKRISLISVRSIILFLNTAWNKSFYNFLEGIHFFILPAWSGALPDVQGVTGTLSPPAWSELWWETFCFCIDLPRDFAFIFRRLALQGQVSWAM